MEPFSSSTFPPADTSTWQKQVQQELKIDNAYETLRWYTAEGFTLEPYYTVDDLKKLPLQTIQLAQKQIPGWLNTPEYVVTDEKAANFLLRDAITRGADALLLTLNTNTDLLRLLNGIKLSDIPILFRLQTEAINAAEFAQQLKTVAPYQLKGGLLLSDDNYIAEVTRLTTDSPLFRTVYASSQPFHNAGASATQELAFTLASLADTYDKLTDAGLPIEQLIPKTILSVSVGTSYFLEIAKLRALRVLLQRFLQHYSSTIIHYPFIHAQTSTFYDATATPYTNLLRATTEAMAAIVAGCDALTVNPYDTVLGERSDFSERIARNVSLLLKDESLFGKVTDPSAGSYYVETATYQLVENAWALFLNVEKQGGLTKAFANGYVQAEIEQAYQAKVEMVRQGNVIVGVTKFRSDEQINTLPKSVSSDITGQLPDRRLAEVFE
ncbi:methylmalonyl-CoA mutase [Spirosoma sp. BT702]|uniref:Methylmalonyl-CoA mutase n=1 Tax=Spirosoma profusum TaxID=2771354 RepID=A0A926Y522_9BACT|nr:methylmalonyl-CoA mutase family protein [Spirosoma profusum]MBD2704075.1 methylmalonyl-CoA mutase [Spirosoma profusum]